MPLDSVRAVCPIARDTIEMDEGEQYRAVYALVAGDTVKLAIEKGTVWHIETHRPKYLTRDSVHVGLPLSRFLVGRDVQIVIGEGKVVLLDRAHCGNSFGLSDEAYSALPGLTVARLRSLPRSTIIDEIIVTGLPSTFGDRCP